MRKEERRKKRQAHELRIDAFMQEYAERRSLQQADKD